MNRTVWTKKRAIITIAICAVLAVSTFALLQMTPTTEAALIDPHPGLVGWWRFDEGNGGVVKDSSGYGNDGIIYGASWVGGKYGEALNFDGIDDRVEVLASSSLQISDAITIAAWVKKDTNINYMGILEKANAYFLVGRNSAPNGFYSRLTDVDGGKTYAFMQSDIAVEQWAHLVVTWTRGDNLNIYYNGDLNGVSIGVLDKNLQTNDNKILIGYSVAGNAYFDGIIDEVRIYNRALSATEIQDTYLEGPNFSSRLVAKIPKGSTQVIATLSWQGIENINMTIEAPSKTYGEETVPVYQRTTYSTSGGTSSMLNIKRLLITVNALSTDENWYIVLDFENIENYSITVETQK